ncbi:MAG: nucleotidyltransferase domain-containing protein [Bacteroidales bacterium]|nr:nucleotidyltransferase domain-containing protein [Bacteroidales bacterium]
MQNIESIKEKIIPILTKYAIHQASIVGSFATGDQTENSDVDLIVKIDEQISLLTFAKIKIELEEALNRKVDLIERSAVKPSLKNYLTKNEIAVI